MTLQEKFKDVIEDAITHDQQYDSFEQIADEFAIEFVRWCFGNENIKDYYIKALNEFKKEKGL